jgi:hypothetical protein
MEQGKIATRYIGAKASDGVYVAADASLESPVALLHPMAEAGKDDEFTRGGLMMMSAQTNGVEMGPDMLLLPIASGCRAISQIAIGTGSVRVVGNYLPLFVLGARSALRLNSDSVVDRRPDALFAAEVSFGGLD